MGSPRRRLLPDPLPGGALALGAVDAGRAWLATLEQVFAEVVENWELEVSEPFPDASASLARGRSPRRAAGRAEAAVPAPRGRA